MKIHRRKLCLAFAFLAVLVIGVGANLVMDRVLRKLARGSATYSFVEDGLYVGGAVDEPPPGTQAVLNLCERPDGYEKEVQVYQWSSIRDSSPAPSLNWLRTQVQFVDKQRQAGLTTYIHCYAGVSRGGMVTTAYLMQKNGWNRDETLRFLRTKRPITNPNPAFMDLLLEWEKELKKN
jgi:hypothetical protein